MMNNILVVNVNWIGDVIFSSPLFLSLKKAYPKAKISCLAVPRVKDILSMIEGVDEIIEFDERGAHRRLLAKLQLIEQLRQKRFDAAFILHRSLTRAFLIYLAGIPVRVGYPTKGRQIFLTHPIKEADEKKMHRSDYYLNIVEGFGVNVLDRSYRLQPSSRDEQEIETILKQNNISQQDRFIVINPGGNWDLKRWPPENWVGLVEHLSGRFGMKIVISGSANDQSLSQQIMERSRQNHVIDLSAKTNLKQLAALFKKAQLVISADSGPLHIAAGVTTPCIGIFGPTRSEITGTRGKQKSIILQKDVGCNRGACYFLECPDNVCMQAVTIRDVYEAAQQIIR